MKPLLRVLLLVAAVLGGLLAVPGTASAGAMTRVGYDVSHPQCGSSLPSARAFAIVGVNGGKATTANRCLAAQLRWAWGSNGTVRAQSRVQLYLNTANPGEVRHLVDTWPSTGSTPYGTCGGENDSACSWQYGYERARWSVERFFAPAAREGRVSAIPSSYTWWLDVETMNTWQSGSPAAQERNRAALEGMTAYLTERGARVGLYSTGHQWGVIVGPVPSTSTLAGRNSWLAGATSLRGAQQNCRKAPLVPRGRVTLTQYVQGGLDHNHSCG